MRFAYIDSQGKKVGIPSVEALQLRIELGAIQPSTMFFDESTDRWAPAAGHEVFRTLQKEKDDQEQTGFVAPPPSIEAPDALAPLVDADSLLSAALTDLEITASDPSFVLESSSLAEEPPAPVEAGGFFPSAFELSGFTIAPIEDALPNEEPQAAWDAGPESDGGESTLGTFEIQTNQVSEREPAQTFHPLSNVAIARPEHTEEESRGAAATHHVVDDRSAALGEEAEGPPGWATEDLAGGPNEPKEKAARPAPRKTAAVPGHDVAFAPVGSPQAVAEEAPHRTPERRRTDARNRQGGTRPASVPRTGPNPTGLVAALVLLAVVGGGGWFAWSMMSGSEPVVAQRTYAPVEIPPIPVEFEPVFRQLATGALLDVAERMATLEGPAGLLEAPPADWLAGQYLANASRYPEVASYWNALGAHLMSLRAGEQALYREGFQNRLSTAAVETVSHDDLTARAMAGFQASLPERDRAYDRLSAVLVAALALHEFLLTHEDEIDYEPVGGGTVMEARPSNDKIGDEMWRRVDEITSALEAMGALSEQVTTRRLFSITLDGVVTASVR